jgi:hypothetical protein
MDFAGAALDVSTRTVGRCAITVEFLSPLPRRPRGSTADAFIIPQISEAIRRYSVAAAELGGATAAERLSEREVSKERLARVVCTGR